VKQVGWRSSTRELSQIWADVKEGSRKGLDSPSLGQIRPEIKDGSGKGRDYRWNPNFFQFPLLPLTKFGQVLSQITNPQIHTFEKTNPGNNTSIFESALCSITILVPTF
jgi:hypothetical protein